MVAAPLVATRLLPLKLALAADPIRRGFTIEPRFCIGILFKECIEESETKRLGEDGCISTTTKTAKSSTEGDMVCSFNDQQVLISRRTPLEGNHLRLEIPHSLPRPFGRRSIARSGDMQRRDLRFAPAFRSQTEIPAFTLR